ncbi:hypothetical protein [Chthonobacter albigriseus]|uniref:hypothetical protein n=1 Tax=Chthonobacter albigriseus TaxID=1683161 RepID=UPI0015EFD68E|nr:hypothetical protein [Chthonobacter albigriseus]
MTKSTVREITDKALKRIRKSWGELDQVNGFGRNWYRTDNPRYDRMKEINDIGVRAFEEIKALRAIAMQDWECFDVAHFQSRIKFHVDALAEARDEVVRARGVMFASNKEVEH